MAHRKAEDRIRQREGAEGIGSQLVMELGALWLGVFLGGIVSGFAGFAFSAVAGAVLLHFFDPFLIIPLMMSCSILSQVATMIALRNAIQWSGARFLLVGGAAGVPWGIVLIAHLESGLVRSTFGLMLVGYAGYLLLVLLILIGSGLSLVGWKAWLSL